MNESPEAEHYVPPVVDEEADLNFGAVDIVLGILTLPLLFWALMYAVSGNEAMYATREARMRVYLILLAMEIALVALGIWWFTR